MGWGMRIQTRLKPVVLKPYKTSVATAETPNQDDTNLRLSGKRNL